MLAAQTGTRTQAPPRTPYSTALPVCSPWNINEHDFPLHASSREKLRFALRYAVLAPSPHNSQPWMFRVSDDAVDVIADFTRQLKVADPESRELIMSCGSTIGILRTALAYFGLAVSMAAFPDQSRKEWIARIKLSGAFSPGAEERARFRAIPARRRNIAHFDAPRPSARLLASLAEHATRSGTRLVYVDEPDVKAEIVRLICEADRVQMNDPAFRAELARWTIERGHPRADGIPCDWHQGADSFPDFGAPEWSQAIGCADPAEYHLARLKQRVGTPPLLAVLCTAGDTPPDWLAAGQALIGTELEARAAGIWFTDFNQPIQVPRTRACLQRLVDAGHPQVLVRIGYGAEVAPTPRRDLGEMLIEA